MASLSNIIQKIATPLTAAFPPLSARAVELPTSGEEPLMSKDSLVSVEKCDLRIEGMTCGACVEVRPILLTRHLVVLTTKAVDRGYA
jgi:P-type Cu+ transporter